MPPLRSRRPLEENEMSQTTSPLAGAALSVVVLLAGLYLRTSESGSSQTFGTLLLAVGILGAVANLAIYVVSRRR